MCGITGMMAFTETGKKLFPKVNFSCEKLSKRGPDGNNVLQKNNATLGHRRLSIIDVSNNASQPMADPSGRYVIIFNGEIFNYKELKQKFFPNKTDWHSGSDTEVLLHLFIKMKQECLQHLHGFFGVAIYD